MNLAEQIKEKIKHPYHEVAEKCNCTPRFVGQIARGERKGLRGKGLEVKKALEKIITQ